MKIKFSASEFAKKYLLAGTNVLIDVGSVIAKENTQSARIFARALYRAATIAVRNITADCLVNLVQSLAKIAVFTIDAVICAAMLVLLAKSLVFGVANISNAQKGVRSLVIDRGVMSDVIKS